MVNSQQDLIHTGGTLYDLTEFYQTKWFDLEETTSDDLLANGTIVNLKYDNGFVVYDPTTTPFTGTKTYDPIPLNEFGVIDGSRIDFDCNSGVAVETSLDNSVWTAQKNHEPIAGLLKGTNCANKFLYVRYVIGSSDPNYKLSRIRICIIKLSDTHPLNSNTTMTVFGAAELAEADHSILDNHPYAGLFFPATGQAVSYISETTGIRAISVWVRRNATVFNFYIFDFRTTVQAWIYFNNIDGGLNYSGISQFYVNGVSRVPTTADFPVGTWTHLTVILPAASTGAVTLGSNATGGNANMYLLRTYSYVPTAQQVYKDYSGPLTNTSYRIVDSSIITGTEIGYNAYKYAWEHTPGG